LRRFLPGGFSSGRTAALNVAGIMVLWLFSGFYRIQPDKQGVELLFVKWDSEPAGP
jgi:membrane protease subunit HflK